METLQKTILPKYGYSVCGLRGAVVSSIVLSLSERVVGSSPPTVVHTLCRSPQLAPGYLANAH